MSVRVGIVGLPNVGKSTLFQALTKKQVAIENYPFVTIEPNVGVVAVPDERVGRLAELSRSRKIIHAVVKFVDIAGLVRGAAEGEGLGNKFLTNIRDVDAIVEVVRVFDDSNVIHVSGGVDPAQDLEVIGIELILKDAETVHRRRESIARLARAGDKTAAIQHEVLEKLADALGKGIRAREVLRGDAREAVKQLAGELGLLTAKARIVVFNASEEHIQTKWRPPPELLSKLKGDPFIVLSAKIEDELNSLSSDERAEYVRSLGLPHSGLDELIRVGYETLGLITFFTTGEDETHAWTIPIGSSAPRAGRAIHSDFEQKFIRADVISWRKLLEAGSWTNARERGWIRTEGKTYIVHDGDVIEFKI